MKHKFLRVHGKRVVEKNVITTKPLAKLQAQKLIQQTEWTLCNKNSILCLEHWALNIHGVWMNISKDTTRGITIRTNAIKYQSRLSRAYFICLCVFLSYDQFVYSVCSGRNQQQFIKKFI